MCNTGQSNSVSYILGCKLFKSSTRKEKIYAALNNPINSELIQQLDEYLDEEYRVKKSKPSKHDDSNSEIKDNSADYSFDYNNADSANTKQGNNFAPSVNSGPRLSEKYGEALDAEMTEKFDNTQINNVQNSEESTGKESSQTTESAESSVRTDKSSISAETAVNIPLIENHVALSGLAGEIKGTLNARESTKGVVRTSVKNDELWIYYSDDTNLNNVMTSVINLLNAANYRFLVFNRLARTDNAIVFAINSNDTITEIGT